MSKPKQLIIRPFLTLLAVAIFVLGYSAISGTDFQALYDQYIPGQPPGTFKVTSVSDGDTIVVDMNGTRERVRLIGIDTPEKNHPELPVQCFAEAASEFTTNLVEGTNVRLEADPTNDNRDRFDRLLRYVYLEDGRLLNQLIIEEGYGFAYLGFPLQKQADFQASENRARENGAGLWSGCGVDFSETTPQTLFEQ